MRIVLYVDSIMHGSTFQDLSESIYLIIHKNFYWIEVDYRLNNLNGIEMISFERNIIFQMSSGSRNCCPEVGQDDKEIE